MEGIVLSLFIITSVTSLNSNSISSIPIPITILVFAACEAAVGLASTLLSFFRWFWLAINISGSNQAVKIINGVDRGSEENIFEKFL